ncbi:DUF1707 and DUF4190 domain-containing protein [Streptacidiphilus rugosus]|uniref:DUF1707 and DUF4190 domain-containing protein n=1 Tax=Streptacidiphilus rugosus TaxID=405783 RepID=UPI001E34F980|nr:DUF1707 and DUF4190 domain-containing protein [Streptacidiphilus rugosus]
MQPMDPWQRATRPAGPPVPPVPVAPVPFPQEAMRAAQADRERTVDVLKAAFAEGRLALDEYQDRAAAAQAAQTYGQLAQLVQDLPVGPMPTPMPAPTYPPAPQLFQPPAPLPPPPYGYPRPYYYGPPPWPPVRRRTNGASVAALLLGLAQVFTAGLSGVPAVICGVIAKRQLRDRDEDGQGMATAGIVLGSLGSVLWVLIFLFGIVAGSGPVGP